MEKKHTRNFSLDVHPYMLTIRKPKVETAAAEPLPSEHNMDTVYLEGTHTIVHVSGAITGKTVSDFRLYLPEEFLKRCFNKQKKAKHLRPQLNILLRPFFFFCFEHAHKRDAGDLMKVLTSGRLEP